MMAPRALLVAAVTLLACACAGVGPAPRAAPYLNLIDVRPVEVTPFEQRYRFSLRVQNPNPAPLRISGLSFELEVNDEVFARGVSHTELDVPAYAERRLEVQATSTTSALLRQLQRLERTQILRYRLKGRVSSPDLPRPVSFDYPGSLPLRRGEGAPAGGGV